LNKEKVPVSYVTVGPVSRDDVMKAMKSLLSEVPEKRKK
jgi:translation initiation factor 5B